MEIVFFDVVKLLTKWNILEMSGKAWEYCKKHDSVKMLVLYCSLERNRGMIFHMRVTKHKWLKNWCSVFIAKPLYLFWFGIFKKLKECTVYLMPRRRRIINRLCREKRRIGCVYGKSTYWMHVGSCWLYRKIFLLLSYKSAYLKVGLLTIRTVSSQPLTKSAC